MMIRPKPTKQRLVAFIVTIFGLAAPSLADSSKLSIATDGMAPAYKAVEGLSDGAYDFMRSHFVPESR